jgi:hypothetical protein
MKHSLISSLACIIFSIGTATSQAFNSAVEYLEFLNKESESVTKDMWDYTSSIARSKGARKIENKRKAVLAQITTAKKNVGSRPAYKSQNFIKDAFINYLKLNFDVLNEDYEKIVNMEEVAEQSYDQMEAYMLVQDQVNDKVKEISAVLQTEVKKYADDNSITLTENSSKISDKLERAGKAFDYYSPLHLIFFKAYIQEANFFAALSRKDLAGAEQAKSALLAAADEGLEKLKAIKAYGDDATLTAACLEQINFYKKEAGTDFTAILDFYTKQDTFEKLDAAMKKKKKSEITKEDTDSFNKAVKEFNDAVAKYNNTNGTLNELRGKKLDSWNKSVENFLMRNAA